jgi:hypothetical protein
MHSLGDPAKTSKQWRGTVFPALKILASSR